MSLQLRVYLDLVRLPNLFTAAADVIAGFACNGGDVADWPRCAILVLVSICFYAGGVALNDVCDARYDAVERPSRPIPSGRISRKAATSVALALIVSGVIIASFTALAVAIVAVGLAVTIVIYDVLVSRTPAGPWAMGLCRALNLALGMVGAHSTLSGVSWTAIVLIWLYVAGLTFFARDEATASRPWRLRMGWTAMSVAVVALIPLALVSSRESIGAVVLALVLSGVLWVAGRKAIRVPGPSTVQHAVKWLVLGLIIFDAAVAGLGAGWAGALLVGGLLAPAVLLGRLFRVT